MDYETEEQQIEALKKWWSENSTMIIGGIAIGVSSIFGWQYYQSQTLLHTSSASVIYEQVLTNSQNTAGASQQLTKVNMLQAEYSDTPYASLSALILARQQFESGELAKAQQQLQWVVDNARQEELKYLANIRLARLLLTTDQADKALDVLNQEFPESFKAIALELKGDALLTQGNKAEAKAAYTQSQLLTTDVNRYLQLKIDDIGETKVNTPEATDKTEPSA